MLTVEMFALAWSWISASRRSSGGLCFAFASLHKGGWNDDLDFLFVH